jgi:hypothetical protein
MDVNTLGDWSYPRDHCQCPQRPEELDNIFFSSVLFLSVCLSINHLSVCLSIYNNLSSIYFETGFHYLVQAGLNVPPSCLSFPSTGIYRSAPRLDQL